jgi:hypothetical protein
MSPSDDPKKPSSDTEQAGSHNTEQAGVRDLIDFYRRWSDFRQTAMQLVNRPDLSSSERLTVQWLVLLMDRISEHDLQPLQRP